MEERVEVMNGTGYEKLLNRENGMSSVFKTRF